MSTAPQTDRMEGDTSDPARVPDQSRVGVGFADAAEPERVRDRLEDLRRSERSMVLVRGAGALFALVQVLAYRELPYPPGVKGAVLALVGVLVAANIAIWLLSRRTTTISGARILALSALSLDVLLASAFVWLYAFDPISALWAILYILPLEGAIRFGLPGALATWGTVTVLYLGREIWRVQAFPSSVEGPGGFGFQPESISFRMGIGLMIALVAGLMARTLMRQRGRLTDALAKLSKINALRARMVATLAHDVRGPLTTIRGTFKTLSRYGDRLDDRTREEMLASADRQAGRMERLATDLLDLARLERGRLDLSIEDVPLEEVVRRSLSFVDEEGRFDVRVAPDVSVRADPHRLEQIIVNIATNALRYGEPPFVAATEDMANGNVSLTFRDHGPGVSPGEREELFEPFRGESDRGSVGLGLAIVRALMEAQGGSVTYEPNEPRGACFRVTLPISAGGADAPHGDRS
jgi:signal transduction histidine kinase